MKSKNIRKILMGLEAQQPWDERQWRYVVLKWVVNSNSPLSVVEHPDWSAMIHMACPSINFFSRRTLDRMLTEHHAAFKAKVQAKVAEAKGRFSFTTDLWTSPAGDPFICVKAHWMDGEWNVMHITIDFSKMEGSHTGVNIFAKFHDVLREWGLTDKLLGVTTDNATNNDTFASELGRRIPTFIPADHHFRCVAHVINLVVQKAVDHAPVKAALGKIRAFITYVYASPQREQQLKDATRNAAAYIVVQPDCKTRWNSTLDMVEKALRMREAINLVVAQAQAQPSTSTDRPPQTIEASEWEVLSRLSEHLSGFTEVTLLCEGERYPTLNRVVPLYNKLLDKMDVIIAGERQLSGKSHC